MGKLHAYHCTPNHPTPDILESMKSNLSAVFTFFLLIGDTLAVIAAFTLAYILRVSLPSSSPFITISSAEYIRLFILLSPVWLGIFAMLRLYDRDVYEWRLREFGRIIVGTLIGSMAMISYEFAVNRPIFPARIIIVYTFGIATLLLILERTIVRGIRLVARHRGIGIINTMLIGDSPYMSDLVESLKNPRVSGFCVVAVVGDRIPSSAQHARHFRDLDDALARLEELNIHSIILTRLYTEPHVNEKIMAAAQTQHIGFRYVPAQEAMYSDSMEVELFQGTPLVLIKQTPLFGFGRIIKRVFDIVAGSLLLLLFAPLIALVCLILVIFDNGEPIYRPKRLTRFNSEVAIYKIRSIKHAYNNLTPEEGFAKLGRPELAKAFRNNGDKLDNDPRFGWFGRLLRRTSIDELPQLINVIKGDISLVGPRPLSAFELDNYPYRHIMLAVKTGVTGLAAISGRKDIPFEERRKIDLYYVQNWSFWLDIKILFRTVLEVLTRRSAD